MGLKTSVGSPPFSGKWCRSSNVFLVTSPKPTGRMMRTPVTRSARKNCKVSDKRGTTLHAFIFVMNLYPRNKRENLFLFICLKRWERLRYLSMRKKDLTLENKIINYNSCNYKYIKYVIACRMLSVLNNVVV